MPVRSIVAFLLFSLYSLALCVKEYRERRRRMEDGERREIAERNKRKVWLIKPLLAHRYKYKYWKNVKVKVSRRQEKYKCVLVVSKPSKYTIKKMSARLKWRMFQVMPEPNSLLNLEVNQIWHGRENECMGYVCLFIHTLTRDEEGTKANLKVHWNSLHLAASKLLLW